MSLKHVPRHSNGYNGKLTIAMDKAQTPSWPYEVGVGYR